MKSHRLRHRVTIQRRVLVDDPAGGQVATWAEVEADVPAEIAPLSAREYLAAQQVQSQVVARITLRYRADLDATMRILHEGAIYNIAGVLPDAKSGREHITVPVSVGVNPG